MSVRIVAFYVNVVKIGILDANTFFFSEKN